MAGTKMYDVCIVFTVYADNDEEALDMVRAPLLPKSTYPMEWAWIYTTLNKGDASEQRKSNGKNRCNQRPDSSR
jgi:hypothetical protein